MSAISHLLLACNFHCISPKTLYELFVFVCFSECLQHLFCLIQLQLWFLLCFPCVLCYLLSLNSQGPCSLA